MAVGAKHKHPYLNYTAVNFFNTSWEKRPEMTERSGSYLLVTLLRFDPKIMYAANTNGNTNYILPEIRNKKCTHFYNLQFLHFTETLLSNL